MKAKHDPPKNIRATRKYKELERALLDNLAARGLVDKAYTDKVREYMDLWVMRQELVRDVEERGPRVYNEKYGEQENRSVSLVIQVSRQMLAIYNALGYKEPQGTGAAAMADDEL